MKEWETIRNVHKRFTHIVNHLKGLGKIFEEEKINVKVLKSLKEHGSQRSQQFLNQKTLPPCHILNFLGS